MAGVAERVEIVLAVPAPAAGDKGWHDHAVAPLHLRDRAAHIDDLAHEFSAPVGGVIVARDHLREMRPDLRLRARIEP